MSEEKEQGAAEAAPAGKKKMAGKTLVLFIILPAVLLLGGGGAAFMMMGKKPPVEAAEGHGDKKGEHGEEAKKEEGGKKDEGGEKEGKKKDEKKEGGHGEKKEGGKEGGDKKDGDAKDGIVQADGPNGEVFLTIPDILVNISSSSGNPSYLKLKLTLQVKDSDTADQIKESLPKIKDQYTGFLRELRVEDIAGSAGYSRLQLELLKRVNLAVAPAQVDAVLIEEMLVQ